jgi:hypothetical protein
VTYSTAYSPDGYAVDTDTYLTDAAAEALSRATYDAQPILAVGRYVYYSRPAPGDVNSEELARILGAGMASWPIGHAHREGWMPSGQLGAIDGQWFARNALAAGYESTTHFELDLEGVNLQASRQQVEDWVGEASVAIAKIAGFPTSLYVGWRAILDSEELWELPTVHLYCSDIAARKVSVRGTAYEQVAMDVVLPGTITKVDVNRLHADARGARLRWTCAAPCAAPADAPVG